MRGFDIRGVGPRIVRKPYIDARMARSSASRTARIGDDALGGRAYYLGRAELEIPLGSRRRELGLRPSVFVDVGAVFGVNGPCSPRLSRTATATASRGPGLHLDANGLRTVRLTTGPVDAVPIESGQLECPPSELASTRRPSRAVPRRHAKPRLSVGFGVNWNSPFGPFRIDIAKALIKAEGDDTKLFTFNVGTAF